VAGIGLGLVGVIAFGSHRVRGAGFFTDASSAAPGRRGKGPEAPGSAEVQARHAEPLADTAAVFQEIRP